MPLQNHIVREYKTLYHNHLDDIRLKKSSEIDSLIAELKIMLEQPESTHPIAPPLDETLNFIRKQFNGPRPPLDRQDLLANHNEFLQLLRDVIREKIRELELLDDTQRQTYIREKNEKFIRLRQGSGEGTESDEGDEIIPLSLLPSPELLAAMMGKKPEEERWTPSYFKNSPGFEHSTASDDDSLPSP